jgi:uncharacterized protein (DUF952 family)
MTTKDIAPVSDGPPLRPDALYHLISEADWVVAQRSGLVSPPSLETEGFVHCSWGHQVAGTVARHFGNGSGLTVLEVDPAGLGKVALVEEDTAAVGQPFPHIYGAIPVEAVVSVSSLA